MTSRLLLLWCWLCLGCGGHVGLRGRLSRRKEPWGGSGQLGESTSIEGRWYIPRKSRKHDWGLRRLANSPNASSQASQEGCKSNKACKPHDHCEGIYDKDGVFVREAGGVNGRYGQIERYEHGPEAVEAENVDLGRRCSCSIKVVPVSDYVNISGDKEKE